MTWILFPLTYSVKIVLYNYILVCNAGYYKDGASCTKCTGNTIKSAPGDAGDCSADQSCDGTTNVPNAGHTTCGEQPEHLLLKQLPWKSSYFHIVKYFHLSKTLFLLLSSNLEKK